MERRRWIVGLGLLGLLGFAALAAWSLWLEPDRLVVRRVTLSLAAWPAGHRPLRLAVLSDIHAGAPFITAGKIDQVVAAINRETPDAIVLLGDYVIHGVIGGDFMAPEDVAARLAGLTAPLGVYGVLGNHDWWLDGPRVSRAMESAGITMIDQTALALERPGGAFWLVGIGDFWQGAPDIGGALAQVTDQAPVILATHNPDLFPDVPDRVALTLAGHTHGGQVNLPLLGRLVVPSQFGARYAYGLVVEGSRHLFVAAGLGTSILPVRFRVPPEIVLLTLRPAV